MTTTTTPTPPATATPSASTATASTTASTTTSASAPAAGADGVISGAELHRRQQAGEAPLVIDVRSPQEYAELHAPGVRLVPLEHVDADVVRAEQRDQNEPVYLICRTGSRSAKAREHLAAAGVSNVLVIEGGTLEWERQGLPVIRGRSGGMSLERQVRIGAGSLVLLGVLLGFLIHPAFFAISAFVGAGLVFAGVTNWCGMAKVLMKMPWNSR